MTVDGLLQSFQPIGFGVVPRNLAAKDRLIALDGAPRIEVHETAYGYYYVSTRDAGNAGDDNPESDDSSH